LIDFCAHIQFRATLKEPSSYSIKQWVLQ
jgi:hypothetical protein